MTQSLKLSLYLQPVDIDGAVTYQVNPGSDCFHDEVHKVHVWDFDPHGIFRLRIDFLHRGAATQSHLKISKIMIEDLDITDTLQFCSYRRYDTNELVTGTHGYMSWPGIYTIPVRYSPLLHRYVMNFYRISHKADNAVKEKTWPLRATE